jgi:hypothetical protein
MGESSPKKYVPLGTDAFTQRFFSDMFIEGGDPDLRERVIARAQDLDAGFREDLFLDLVGWDATKLRDALRRINVPTLVLQSTYMDSDLGGAPPEWSWWCARPFQGRRECAQPRGQPARPAIEISALDHCSSWRVKLGELAIVVSISAGNLTSDPAHHGYRAEPCQD